MKKKVLSAFIATIMCAACVVGFTACGGSGLPKGEELADEAAWQAAFEKTAVAQNVTAVMKSKSNATTTGKDADGKTVTAKSAMKNEMTLYLGDDSYRAKQYITSDSTGGDEAVNIKRSMESYAYLENATIWSCYYEEQTGYEEEGEEPVKPEWLAIKNECETAAEAKEELSNEKTRMLAYLFNDDFSSEEGGEDMELDEMYSQFTYSNGTYKAKLYTYISGLGEIQADVELSFKDGYFMGYTIKASVETEYLGTSIKANVTGSLIFSNFGSTTVSAPKGAVEAVETAKKG